MEFKKEQKTAILHVSLAMVEADGRIDVKEPGAVVAILEELGVQSSAEQKQLVALAKRMTPCMAVVIISKLPDEGKEYVASRLRIIMEVDGDIDTKELALLKLVASFCGLPIKDIGK